MVGRGTLALAGVSAAAAAAIAYVHHSQRVERQNLRRGLARDAEVYRQKSLERAAEAAEAAAAAAAR